MTKTARTFRAATTLGMLLLSARAFGADLAPTVLAQVNQSGGFSFTPDSFSVRILEDGRIEEFEYGKWTVIGTLSAATVVRFTSASPMS